MNVKVESTFGDVAWTTADQWDGLAEAADVVRGMYSLTVRRERFLQDLAANVRLTGPPVAAIDPNLGLTVTITR